LSAVLVHWGAAHKAAAISETEHPAPWFATNLRILAADFADTRVGRPPMQLPYYRSNGSYL
jgi:hypothetical protein